MSSIMGQPTELAWQVDKVQFFILLVMAFCFVACNAVLIYFMLRYRRKSPDQEVSTVAGNHVLEIVWTAIPTVVCFIIFYYGIVVWTDLRTPPEDAMEINVTGQKWSWAYEYADGRTVATDLYVPQGEAVRLVMKSVDVIHSFYIPEFRVKEDVVPSYYTNVWFKAEKPGSYNIFCAEYCGIEHSGMLGKLHVLTPEEWEAWQKEAEALKAMPPHERGKNLFSSRGCAGCHSIDGSSGIGPSIKGLYGSAEELANGSTVQVDENYLSTSILRPNAQIVAGYQPNQMPAFEGQLKEQDISDLIAYIKTLK